MRLIGRKNKIDLSMYTKEQIERGFLLFVNWAEECDFGYDNIPNEYKKYKHIVDNMDYIDGLIYIALEEALEGGECKRSTRNN